MGKERLVDKTVAPQEVMPQQVAGMTIAQALQNRLASYLIGGYKGQAAFLDLDKLVNEPLAAVEGIYTLDKIDARDVITATLPIGAVPADGVITDQLVVPAGELWILTQLTVACPVTAVAGEIISANFRFSQWQIPDVRGGATVNEAGRAYLATALAATSAVAIAENVVFNDADELGFPLRLPAGSIVTLVAAAAGDALTVAKSVTLTPHGRKIRRLVV